MFSRLSEASADSRARGSCLLVCLSVAIDRATCLLVRWKNGNVTEDAEGGCEDWEAGGTQKKKRSKGPAKKKGVKGKPVQSEENTPSKEKPNKRMMVFGKYTPGKFAQARRSYIARIKDTCGYREACKRWNNSDEKWELLSEMPHQELVRRRFLPPQKSC